MPDTAAYRILPAIEGPGECSAPDIVGLDAVIVNDKRRVFLEGPAILRCKMAAKVVEWVREEVAPLFAEGGAPLSALVIAGSYECRGRNRVAGSTPSQHGLANALDIRALKLTDGKTLMLTDPTVEKHLRVRLMETACARFSTVLGPGSDGYHEDHVHMDLAERRNAYRICQWDVREPPRFAPSRLSR